MNKEETKTVAPIFKTNKIDELFRAYAKTSDLFFNELNHSLEAVKHNVKITIIPIENDTKLAVYLGAFSSNIKEIEEDALHTFAVAQLYLKQKYSFKKMRKDNKFADYNYVGLVKLKSDAKFNDYHEPNLCLECFVDNIYNSIRYSFFPETKSLSKYIVALMHPEPIKELVCSFEGKSN